MSTDCPAFYNLFKSLGGNDPALTSTNCCSWATHKVVCDSGNRVIQIRLELMGLNGTISSDIGKLTGLKEFSIASNNVTGVFPPEISIPKYAAFDVDDNNMYGPIPELTFDTRYSKYYVEFHHNAFTGNIPQSYYTANITANGNDNGGCPFDSDLCAATPPPGCQKVTFTCTPIPHRYAVPTPVTNSTGDPQSSDGFFSHTGNVIGLVAGVLVLIVAVVGLSLFVFAKKKQVDDLKTVNTPQSTSAIHNFVGQQANQFQADGGYSFDPVSGSPITAPQYIPGQTQFVQPPNPALTSYVPSSPSLQSTNISAAQVDQFGNPIVYPSQPFLTTINGQQFIATIQTQPPIDVLQQTQTPSVQGSVPTRSPTVKAPDTPTIDPQFATPSTQPRHDVNTSTSSHQPRLVSEVTLGQDPRFSAESPKNEVAEVEKGEIGEPDSVEIMPPTLHPDPHHHNVEMMPPTIPNNFLAEMNELRNGKAE
ncbi:hypothetical protein HDV06_004819 [Boothiomyces sp. JEL0866]|nr:hypothetical protein HDV06_004819 [Boothiomyces sp. JEL0866]